jgi:hypothetical protein
MTISLSASGAFGLLFPCHAMVTATVSMPMRICSKYKVKFREYIIQYVISCCFLTTHVISHVIRPYVLNNLVPELSILNLVKSMCETFI